MVAVSNLSNEFCLNKKLPFLILVVAAVLHHLAPENLHVVRYILVFYVSLQSD